MRSVGGRLLSRPWIAGGGSGATAPTRERGGLGRDAGAGELRRQPSLVHHRRRQRPLPQTLFVASASSRSRSHHHGARSVARSGCPPANHRKPSSLQPAVSAVASIAALHFVAALLLLRFLGTRPCDRQSAQPSAVVTLGLHGALGWRQPHFLCVHPVVGCHREGSFSDQLGSPVLTPLRRKTWHVSFNRLCVWCVCVRARFDFTV